MKRIMILAAVALAIGMTCAAKASEAQPPLRVAIRGVGAWARGWIFSRRAEEAGHPDCGHCGGGPRAIRDVREEVWTGRQAVSRRPGRTGEGHEAASGAGLHLHARPPESGGDLREDGRAGNDGKAPGGERRGRLRDRRGRKRRENHRAGELRNVVVSEQSRGV